MILALVLALWLFAVIIAAASGWLAALHPPLIAAMVAATIMLPMLAYAALPGFRRTIAAIGHRRIIIFHIWRIPAALLFFWFGMAGELPPLFWVLAGSGDLVAGAYALRLARQPTLSAAEIHGFHRFGLADFVVAVGTGLSFTLLGDLRMAPVASLPLALVVLYGVGISGASHLMAFAMLRRARA
ncbi:hypothetical protein GCM10007973_32270 [Polymorphobacter multimanifer]|uniref:Uncharacterized protein n=1 Tax=Polymorphobacter multimanifer TaxID=1070431 RepID=A0A841LB75_9SPHN|nr:permease [Polymorphobacter multimanifer]MBB6228223.1 hypothetical protein [Polymorphobacter multimanifer]GGI93550.1 hypothetical protein GCM10007973_32270 [Polymorphobacter multimanifer]